MSYSYHHQHVVSELVDRLCGSNAIGAEIGVWAGSTSDAILRSADVHKIYMIDPWMPGYSTDSTSDVPSEDFEVIYAEVKERFESRYPGRFEILRKTSVDAHKEVPDDLDFVFIDATHEYDSVMEDLSLWFPKVKSGGLISGHDWNSKFRGVINAVTEFFTKHQDEVRPPFDDYSDFRFGIKHCPCPSSGPVVNKSIYNNVWWTIKK